MFGGSGIVARLAKVLGFRVTVNDWEPYARVLNRCYLATEPGMLPGLFAPWGGLDRVLEDLQSRPDPSAEPAIASLMPDG